MNHQGYIAAVISKHGAAKLSKLARHSRVFCHHVTMAYRPSGKVYRKYADFIGTEIIFEITEIVSNEKGQAVRVRGVPTENKHSHITVSCADGVNPVYSNTLLTRKKDRRIRPYKQKVRATIQFIPL